MQHKQGMAVVIIPSNTLLFQYFGIPMNVSEQPFSN